MNLSLGEIESMARKAARGAGYAWGIADEAGFAVRWLEARGQDGVAALAGLLEQVEGSDLPALAPRDTTSWTSTSGRLCPLLTGTALADAAHSLPDTGLMLSTVKEQLLLLPFAAHVADVKGRGVIVEAGHGRAMVHADALCLSGDWPGEASMVAIEFTSDMAKPGPSRSRVTPDDASWRILNRFASRTYAPATEASRLKGAGAGLNDND